MPQFLLDPLVASPRSEPQLDVGAASHREEHGNYGYELTGGPYLRTTCLDRHIMCRRLGSARASATCTSFAR
jgi:hypothetical protein